MKRWQEDTMACFLGPLYRHLRDPAVSEILVNGPSSILVEKAGTLCPTGERFESEEALVAAIAHIAQVSQGTGLGAKASSKLIVEGRLPDGSRVEAVLPPAVQGGPVLAIRRFARAGLSLADLVRGGSLSASGVQTLRAACRGKKNLLVAGGTGSGKTSLLNALGGAIPAGERVICIEDTPELQLDCSHLVSLVCCEQEGGDAVGVRELFRASLRLRPDRIVIGEIRGGEALDLLQAMTSGHGGCMSTIHASRPADALRRLETLALMSDVELPLAALRHQVASAIDVVVQTERTAEGHRRVSSISELRGVDDQGRYRLVEEEACDA